MDGVDFEGPPPLPPTQQPVDEMLSGNNMVANLPLLFAAGYPTTLARITETQLEQFIPFMVQCSLGCIQIMHEFEYSEPEWWPENVPFVIPLRRPAGIAPTDWHKKLREIVVICYSFHKVVYLLRFCDDLSTYQPESLRFINNQNTTTSLFERVTNKLLVTFRNENMLYDHKSETNTKKTLMPRHAVATRTLDVSRNGVGSTGDHDDINDYQIIDSAPFDIILCEFCDAELYSEQAYRDHERVCLMDDDVIFCGTETLSDTNGAVAVTSKNAETTAVLQLSQSSACASPEYVTPAETLATERLAHQAHFLHHFGLGNAAVPIDRPAAPFITDAITKSPSKQSSPSGTGSKLRRWPRRGRAVLGLAKCPTIPISSPAGQRMVRTAKSLVTVEYLSERLERVERFCQAPMLGQHKTHQHQHNNRKSTIHTISTHPYLVASSEAAAAASATTPITYRRPAAGVICSTHQYTFPRRQFRQMTRVQRFRLLNVSEMRQCVPMTVPLQKLTDNQIEQLRQRPHHTNFQREMMRRRRERKAMRRWRRLDQQQQSASAEGGDHVDSDATMIIDLCSDDDDEVDTINGVQANGTGSVIASLRPPPPLLFLNDQYQRGPFDDPFAYTVDPMSLVSVGTVDPGEPVDVLLQCSAHSNISDISITRRHGKQQRQSQNNRTSNYNHPQDQQQPSSNESTPTTTTLSLLNDLTACSSASSSSSTSSVTSHDSVSVPTPAMPALRKRPPIVESVDSGTAKSVKRGRFRNGPHVSERSQQRSRVSTATANGAQHSLQYDMTDVDAAAATVQQQESVSIYSRSTHTAMTLANHRQLMYDHGNQENQRYAVNASATTTTTNNTTSPPVHQQPMHQHMTNISGSAGIVPIVDPSSACLMDFELPTGVTLTTAATASHNAAGKYIPLVSQPEIVIERIPSVLQQQQQHNQQQQHISIDLTLT